MGSAATISATIPSAYLAVPGSEKAPGLFVILLYKGTTPMILREIKPILCESICKLLQNLFIIKGSEENS